MIRNEAGKMGLSIYFVLNGVTREAVQLYEQAFNAEPAKVMTFRDMPENEGHVPEAAMDLVMHANMEIFGSRVMFSDTLPGMEHTVGNNITVAVLHDDVSKLEHAFNTLAEEGGKVVMPLQETPWSKRYGQVTDRFGVEWQFNHEEN